MKGGNNSRGMNLSISKRLYPGHKQNSRIRYVSWKLKDNSFGVQLITCGYLKIFSQVGMYIHMCVCIYVCASVIAQVFKQDISRMGMLTNIIPVMWASPYNQQRIKYENIKNTLHFILSRIFIWLREYMYGIAWW